MFNDFRIGLRASSARGTPIAVGSPLGSFRLTDSFGANDGVLRNRPGWAAMPETLGGVNAVTVGGGVATVSAGAGGACSHYVDIGRTDRFTVEATLTAMNAGAAGLWFGMLDPSTSFFLAVDSGTATVFRLLDHSTLAPISPSYAHTRAAGDRWKIEVEGTTARLYLNGARFPDGATSFGLSAIPVCGRVGFNGLYNSWMGVWDDFTVTTGPDPVSRLALDPVRRVIQRERGATSKALAISGQCTGVSAIEMRLTRGGTAVAGWDWGQKPLTGLAFTADGFSATTAPVPQGDGYRLEIRDANDHGAGSISGTFGVGIVWALYGQSNAVQLATNPGVGGAGAATSFHFDGGYNPPLPQDEFFVGLGDTGATWADNVLTAAAGNIPVGVISAGCGGEYIDHLRPGSTYLAGGWDVPIWTAFEREITAAGGDIEAVVYLQGENDAGNPNSIGPIVNPGQAAAYKAALDSMYARLKAMTGRSAAQLPFLILGLGKIANTDNAADSASPGWTAVRQAQAEWCRDTPGAALIGTALDLAYNTTQAFWIHYADSDAGYGEAGRRVGAGLARALGYAMTDRRGPVATGMTRSGNTLVIALDRNGTTGWSCAVPIASNFAFATDASFATALAPTAMAIDHAAGAVTFTFASAPPAGAAVRGPRGINPDTANALKGSYPDGTSVIALPILLPLLAA